MAQKLVFRVPIPKEAPAALARHGHLLVRLGRYQSTTQRDNLASIQPCSLTGRVIVLVDVHEVDLGESQAHKRGTSSTEYILTYPGPVPKGRDCRGH